LKGVHYEQFAQGTTHLLTQINILSIFNEGYMGNSVKINNLKNLEWYVGDSKINELMQWLNDNGKLIRPPITKFRRVSTIRRVLSTLRLMWKGETPIN